MSIQIGKGPDSGPPPARRPRTDRVTTAWMIAALILAVLSAVTRGVVPQTWWTAIHLVTLGVLTNGILQWSWYFSRSLLRLPRDSRVAGRDQVTRQLAFNVFLTALVASMWLSSLPGVLIATTGIGIVLAWHGIALLLALRTKMGSRFAVVIRYYVVAAAALVVGCVLAGLIVTTMFAAEIPDWLVRAREDLTLAHSLINFLGWIGLSIAGTLVTLGPTILRVRMDPGAVRKAVSALPLLTFALIGLTATAVIGQSFGVGIFLLIYVAGIVWAVGVPLAASATRMKRIEYPGMSMLAGVGVVMLGLIAICVALLAGATQIPDVLIGVVGAGGVLSIFMGALSYLMPVVIGGGPASVKVGIAILERGGVFRLTLRYAALVLAALAVPPAVGTGLSWWWLVVAATYGADIVAMAFSGVLQARAKRAAAKETTQKGETDG